MVVALVQVCGFAGIVWRLAQHPTRATDAGGVRVLSPIGEIAMRMPPALRTGGLWRYVVGDVMEPMRTQVVLSVIEYLNLSSEENRPYRKGRLTKDIWQVTAAEIERRFGNEVWREAWQMLRNEYASDARLRDRRPEDVHKQRLPHRKLARGRPIRRSCPL